MRRALLTRFLLATLVLAAVACGGQSPAAPSGSGRFDVLFPGAGVSIGGALYRPDLLPGQTAPALVIVHGHLPTGVNGAATIEAVAGRYRDRGYVALALSMRGWPPSGGDDDCALEQPTDLVQAVEWIKRQPGVNPARVGLIGFSKGGQNVLLAAARGADVRAVVAYYPPTDLARWQASTDREDTKLYIARLCEPPPGLAPRSPVTHAAAIAAPVLLMHGDADQNVPIDQSLVMEAAMRAAGRDVRLFVVPGGGHGFAGEDAEVAYPVVDLFLAERLR